MSTVQRKKSCRDAKGKARSVTCYDFSLLYQHDSHLEQTRGMLFWPSGSYESLLKCLGDAGVLLVEWEHTLLRLGVPLGDNGVSFM